MSAILTNSKYGPTLVPPYDEYLGKAFIVNGSYGDEEFEAWVYYINKGSTVLDIGANFGAHTFHFSNVAGKVIAFEPQLELYRMLNGSLALQHRSNVFAMNVAVGETGGTGGTINCPSMNFMLPNNFGGVSLLEEWSGRVSLMAIDSIGLDSCDFIKIDVEGMELQVLKGAESTIMRNRPIISVEADREDKAFELYTWLIEHKYKVKFHCPPLGDLWPNVNSRNFLAVPGETHFIENLPHVYELESVRER